jgi:hypothetical protein
MQRDVVGTEGKDDYSVWLTSRGEGAVIWDDGRSSGAMGDPEGVVDGGGGTVS